MEFHPIANLFPLMQESELDDLANDICKHGQHEPIISHDGKILDGRNRFLACQKAGVEPECVTYAGNDPVAFVVSMNLRRRHLNESQRAMIAAEIATMKEGRPSKTEPIGSVSRNRAASLLNVGERSVERARRVKEKGVPELQAAIDSGEVSVYAASQIVGLPESKQRKLVGGGAQAIHDTVKKMREKKRKDKERIERGKLLAMTEDMAECFSTLEYKIGQARKERWETTSREAIQQRIKILTDLVELGG